MSDFTDIEYTEIEYTDQRINDVLDCTEDTSNPIILSQEALAGTDEDLLECNVETVNALLDALLEDQEISTDALRSYYVDYYFTQMTAGGFTDFISDSGWDPTVNDYILQGLKLMGANTHLEHFRAGLAAFEHLSEEDKEELAESEFINIVITSDSLTEEKNDGVASDTLDSPEDPLTDIFDDFDEEFEEIDQQEDLTALNAAWLRGLSNVNIVAETDIPTAIDILVAAIPNLKERQEVARAREDEATPEFEHIIRALADSIGQEVESITIGDPNFEWQGESAMAWHFNTDEGEYVMVSRDNKAYMIDGESRETLVEAEIEYEDA